MKKLILAIALLFATASAFAQNVIRRTDVLMTSNPANNDTVTINGSVRTFKTSVSTPATEVAIGADAAATLANYAAQILAYPYTGCNTMGPDGTTVRVFGPLNAAMTASKSGSWGSVTVVAVTVTQYGYTTPLAHLNSTDRAARANSVVSDLVNYATTAASAGSAFLQNFVNLSASQTITGAKTFTGATIISNSAARLYSLLASNIVITNSVGHFSTLYADDIKIYTPLVVSNAFPSILFHTVGGSSDEKRSILTTYGDQTRYVFVSDDGATENDVFIIGRTGATPDSLALYTKLVLSPTGIGMQGGLATNLTTTNAIGGFSQAFVDGLLQVSANAGIIRMVDTGGSANDKTTDLVADGDAFTIRFKNDAGSTAANPFTITRVDGAADIITLAANLITIDGATAFTGDINVDASLYASTAVVSGDNTPTIPSGFSAGFYALDSSSPSADPITGAILFSSSGAIKYRTSGTSEGSGGTFFLHNRASTTQAAGSDYTFTGSTAALDMGTDPIFQASTDGTYFITAQVAVVGAADNDRIILKLRNTSAGVDISNSDAEFTHVLNGKESDVTISGIATLTAAQNVTIFGHNASAARGTAEADRTRITGIRLY